MEMVSGFPSKIYSIFWFDFFFEIHYILNLFHNIMLTIHFIGACMKQYSLFAILLITVLFGCIFTGFQCGSTEMTSAKLYINRQDWPNAETALEKEVAKNPTNAEAWYNLGIARIQLGKFESVVTALDNCLKNSTLYAEQVKNAKLNVWGQVFNKGISYHNQMAKASTDSQSILLQSAIREYKLALQINPDSVGPYQNLAAIYHTAGNTDEEIAIWKEARARRNDPQFTAYIIDAMIKKADDAKAKGDKQTANEYLNKAIIEIDSARKANPDDSEMLGSMINLYIEAGRSKEAMPYMREAIQKDPKNKVFQNDLGLLLMQTDSLDEAAEHFAAAVAADSTYEDALRNGSVAYVKMGQKMKEEATAKDPKGKSSNKAYVAKFKVAVTLLEKLVSIKPENPDFWDAIASAYGNAGMFKEAENAIKKADSLRKK
jgi:Flp pilus assembly protein TadD